MSSFSPFSAKSVVLSPDNVMRLNPEHAKTLEKFNFNKDHTYRLFGDVDIERMLTMCYLSLGIVDDEGKLVGAILLQTYPNISALPTTEWSPWIQNKYGLTDANSRNTLWIHLALGDPNYYMVFFEPMLQSLFKIRNFLQYAIMIIPPGRHKLDFTGSMGVPVIPAECRKGQSTYLLMFCRSNFILQYKIRRAVEEDNDDLVPLIESYSKRFTEIYGEFYIAEILMRGKEVGRQLIVAEYQGTAVAVLCLNPVVNYQVLNEDFELVPYNGLKKPHPDDYADLEFEFVHASAEKIRRSKTLDEESITGSAGSFGSDNDNDEELTLFEKQYGITMDDADYYYIKLNKNDNEYHEKWIVDIIDKKSVEGTDRRSTEDEEYFIHVSASDSDQFSIVFTSASMFVFQDDEDIDDNASLMGRESISSAALISQFVQLHEKETYNRDEMQAADQHADWISAYSATKSLFQKVPEFKGEENAFALEIAASLPNHEYGIIELFDAAFECFPDKDYCVMAIPHTVPVRKLTKYFNRVPPRASGTFPFELYCMHKNSMLANIDVDRATKEHEKAVKTLISTIPNSPMILEQFENSINVQCSPYYSYVAVSEDHVVGIAIVSEETDLDYLQAHYDLSALNLKMYRSGSQGVLDNLVLSPIFLRHDKYFLREIHRLSEFDILYYRHTAYDSSEAYRERPLMNLLSNLLPIMPIMQPQYDLTVLTEEECLPSDVVLDKKEPFALYVSTLPLCSLSKHNVNTKILIIGCSHTALAFIQALLFKQSLNYMVTFNNLTLVCANGLTHNRVTPRIRDVFMVKKNFWDTRYMDMISLKTYINLIQGKLTKIDRKEQYITVNSTNFIDYDLLFLMCGEQFQRPTGPNKTPFREKPENVIVMNNALDANNAVIKLKHLYHKYNDQNYVIIIYGHFLQAHAAIFGLINYGIPGSHMVLIEPFPYSMALEKRQRHNVSIYNDPEIDAVVYENIRNEGIKIYSSFYFIDWTYDMESNVITRAKFESKHKMLEVECMAMFFFNEKEISPRIYRVINSAGLVYDGRLVIDVNCQTNDPNIYGAGTLTKYSRKYYAPNMSHKFFNRIEIGKRLGLQIREKLLQQRVRKWEQEESGGWNFHIERGESLVSRYVQPIMRYCRLPGGLYYLSITKPGRRVPLETAVCMENYGQVLITGNCRNLIKQGYFQLHLNEFKRVETITCLNKVPIDIYNIHCLWGKHEKLLNNLALRFEMVLITDLFDFFKEPWAYALYHDKFNSLLDELNMLMTSSVGSSGEASLINELIALFKQSRWQPLTKEAKDSLEEKFRSLAYPKIIEYKVLNFIKANLRHLPMYAHPIVVRDILRNYSNSPLFSN